MLRNIHGLPPAWPPHWVYSPQPQHVPPPGAWVKPTMWILNAMCLLNLYIFKNLKATWYFYMQITAKRSNITKSKRLSSSASYLTEGFKRRVIRLWQKEEWSPRPLSQYSAFSSTPYPSQGEIQWFPSRHLTWRGAAKLPRGEYPCMRQATFASFNTFLKSFRLKNIRN